MEYVDFSVIAGSLPASFAGDADGVSVKLFYQGKPPGFLRSLGEGHQTVDLAFAIADANPAGARLGAGRSFAAKLPATGARG